MLLPAAVVVYVGHYWEIGRHLHQGWLYNAMQCGQRCTICTRLYSAMCTKGDEWLLIPIQLYQHHLLLIFFAKWNYIDGFFSSRMRALFSFKS